MAPLRREFVTIVSGVPRAGTSLLMQLLEAGGIPAVTDGARAPDASNPRGYYEHALVPSLGRDPRAAALVRSARGRALKVIHALLPALPADLPLRVLLAERPLPDVVASQAHMLERNRRNDTKWGQTPSGVVAAERLAEIYAAQLDEALGALAARPACAVLRVDTARLVREPAPACARIAAFLGGGLDEAAMARAISPALYGRSRGYAGPVMDAAKSALGKEQIDTAFFIAADLVLADGTVEPEEKKFLEDLQQTLGVSEETATKIVEVVVIKNR